MKLIIDIPEIFYQNEKENKGYVSDLKRDIVWDAMINGTPLVEQESKTDVLDKIRAEIEQAKTYTYKTEDEKEFTVSADSIVHPNYRFYTSGLNKALDIIDKYKAERSE